MQRKFVFKKPTENDPKLGTTKPLNSLPSNSVSNLLIKKNPLVEPNLGSPKPTSSTISNPASNLVIKKNPFLASVAEKKSENNENDSPVNLFSTLKNNQIHKPTTKLNSPIKKHVAKTIEGFFKKQQQPIESKKPAAIFDEDDEIDFAAFEAAAQKHSTQAPKKQTEVPTKKPIACVKPQVSDTTSK